MLSSLEEDEEEGVEDPGEELEESPCEDGEENQGRENSLVSSRGEAPSSGKLGSTPESKNDVDASDEQGELNEWAVGGEIPWGGEMGSAKVGVWVEATEARKELASWAS